MSELIRIPKKQKEVTITEVKPQPAPDIPRIYHYEFETGALEILEEKLADLGIVIPKEQLKKVTPALHDIGKKYYSYAAMKNLFSF